MVEFRLLHTVVVVQSPVKKNPRIEEALEWGKFADSNIRLNAIALFMNRTLQVGVYVKSYT